MWYTVHHCFIKLNRNFYQQNIMAKKLLIPFAFFISSFVYSISVSKGCLTELASSLNENNNQVSGINIQLLIHWNLFDIRNLLYMQLLIHWSRCLLFMWESISWQKMRNMLTFNIDLQFLYILQTSIAGLDDGVPNVFFISGSYL